MYTFGFVFVLLLVKPTEPYSMGAPDQACGNTQIVETSQISKIFENVLSLTEYSTLQQYE